MPPYDVKLSYMSQMNRFVDEDLCVVHDLHTVFDNWQLEQWKRAKRSAILVAKTGKKIKLVYLTPPEEEDMYEDLAYNDAVGAQTDRDRY